MEVYLIINTALTTLSLVMFGVAVYLFHGVVRKRREVLEMVDAMKMAHNIQVETLGVVTSKLQDMDMRLSMRRSG